jgi:hypothetical protein
MNDIEFVVIQKLESRLDKRLTEIRRVDLKHEIDEVVAVACGFHGVGGATRPVAIHYTNYNLIAVLSKLA